MKNVKFVGKNEIPENVRIPEEVNIQHYLANGELLHFDGNVQKVISPVSIVSETGSVDPTILGSFPLLTEKESGYALEAAVRAYDNGKGEWPSMPVKQRIKAVEKFCGLMQSKRDEVVKLLMWETAKPLKDSEKEFDRTIEYILQTLKELKKQENQNSSFEVSQGVIARIRRSPLGVVLCMGPYNYPLNETFTTLIPALLMGNTVIFKPAKIGVLLVNPLLESFREAFPKGVINVIFGRGRSTVQNIMASGKLDAFAFIGTSKSANEIRNVHPKPNRLKSVLALEAKNPAVVLSHADLSVAVKECVTGSLSFNGQRCTALKIIFVHNSVANEFLKGFLDEIAKLKRGMPWESGVFLTPLPEPDKPAYLKELIEDALQKGASVINEAGGELTNTFVEPAVLFPVNPLMRIYKEEQFGPVVPVVPFDNIDTVMEYLNASDHGQQLSLFGQNPDEIGTLVDRFINHVCRININSQCQRSPDNFPFNGRKDSGYGTLSISDALKAFSIKTIVAAKENEVEKDILESIILRNHSSFLSREMIL